MWEVGSQARGWWGLTCETPQGDEAREAGQGGVGEALSKAWGGVTTRGVKTTKRLKDMVGNNYLLNICIAVKTHSIVPTCK